MNVWPKHRANKQIMQTWQQRSATFLSNRSYQPDELIIKSYNKKSLQLYHCNYATTSNNKHETLTMNKQSWLINEIRRKLYQVPAQFNFFSNQMVNFRLTIVVWRLIGNNLKLSTKLLCWLADIKWVFFRVKNFTHSHFVMLQVRQWRICSLWPSFVHRFNWTGT